MSDKKQETKVFLTGEWRNLVMMNFVVPEQVLKTYLPNGVELDAFDGKCYISFVAFHFLDTKIKGIGIPFHKDFDKTLAAPYNNTLIESKKVRLSIHGHDHNYSTSHPYGSEIEYLVSGTINKRSYSLISVTDDDYEIEKVEY